MASLPPLTPYLPHQPDTDSDALLARFLDWTAEAGFELFPAQEQGLLELFAGKHVILQTPTGSGKSLVAMGLIYRTLAAGETVWYTSPIKALASEKFFDFCDLFGADRVGLQTGDGSINSGAGLICATAEVLANVALRRGDALGARAAVLDEFHYYSDPDRGAAWQIPLLAIPNTQFLLMSATLGDVTRLAERIERRSGRSVVHVHSTLRPVPLDWEWRETPIQRTIEDLVDEGKSPIYAVNFTQRECAELAQALTSLRLQTRAEKARVAERIADFRFDTPYGKELRRVLRFGIGVHHAGLLPKYRLLVEQLAQDGLLEVICGTDTLGVGVNIPLRTVLFSSLVKFDGKEMTLLRAREFHQIAGRAGRKGFDDKGSVVCQAPDDMIEKKRGGPKKGRPRRKPPKGVITWSRATFDGLIRRAPETLVSRFAVNHGLVLQLVQRDADLDLPEERNFSSLRRIIDECHEEPGRKRQFLHDAAVLVRSLHLAGILRLRRDPRRPYWQLVVDQDLQREFSLHQPLALYLVEAIARLDREDPAYPARVLSFTEAVLENPRALIRRQVDREKSRLLAQWRQEGIPFEERIERLESVTHPQPEAQLIEAAFAAFRELHPWVGAEEIHPKGIAREMWEGQFGFNDYVRDLGVERAEGALLRYLSQLDNTLHHTIPDSARTEAFDDLRAFFRAIVEHVDTSLLEEWQSLMHPELLVRRPERRHELHVTLELAELLADGRAFAARVRAEMRSLIRVLSRRDFEEAALLVRADELDPEGAWSPERWEREMATPLAELGEVLNDHEARLSDKTRIRKVSDRLWAVTQVLVGKQGPSAWCLEGEVDLRSRANLDGPFVTLRRIAGA